MKLTLKIVRTYIHIHIYIMGRGENEYLYSNVYFFFIWSKFFLNSQWVFASPVVNFLFPSAQDIRTFIDLSFEVL